MHFCLQMLGVFLDFEVDHPKYQKSPHFVGND